MGDKKMVDNVVNLQKLRDLIDTEKSRQVIADNIGCDVSLITRHYNGQKIVTIDFLKRYAEYFKVSADYLLDLSDAKTNDKDLQAVCDFTGLSEKTVLNFETIGLTGCYSILKFIEIFTSKLLVGSAVRGTLDCISYLATELCCLYDCDENEAGTNVIDEQIASNYHDLSAHRYEFIRFIENVMDDFCISFNSGGSVLSLEEQEKEYFKKCAKRREKLSKNADIIITECEQ